jgi:DNA-binding transcriptional ArsR family regulator
MQTVRHSSKQALPDVVFKSLADPTRRGGGGGRRRAGGQKQPQLFRDGEQTVRMLTDSAGVSQPAVSKHLRVLKHAGLVRARHSGRETHYIAQPRALAPLMNWMSFYSRFWHDRIDRLEDLLERMDP